MKTLAEVLNEGNSTVNQEIKGKFIDQHVHINVNTMVEYILSKGYEDENAPFNSDEVDNLYTLPELNGTYVKFEGGTEDEREQEIERLEQIAFDMGECDEGTDEIEQEIDELKELESEPQEVLEWWSVSSFLCAKLQALGHPVLSYENIWGRCTSGQAILLDHSITQICADMGILDGQESSWA